MSVRVQQAKDKRTTSASVRSRVDAYLDGTMVGKNPLRWYITGWRLGLIAVIGALIFPQVAGSQSLIVTAITIGIYVMLALGLNIVVGFAGLLDLGYVAFYVIGSYTAAVGSFGAIQLSNNQIVHIPIFPFWLLLALGAVLAGLFGALLGAPTLRLRGDYLAIVTLGFGEIVPTVFQNLPYFYGQLGISALPPGDINLPTGTISFSNPLDYSPFYYLTLALVVLITVVVILLRDSSVGRAWVAIREDETAAAASGVNLVRTKLLAFGLGATIGGVGGALNAAFTTSITPLDFNFIISITILIMIVLGGLGSVPGVIVGAILLRFFDVYLLGQINDWVHKFPLVANAGTPLHFLAAVDFNASKYLIYGVILVAMILLRPQGLIPNIRRKMELKGEGAAPESFSAVGIVEREEQGLSMGGAGSEDETLYEGAGSDAQRQEEGGE